MVAAQVDSSDPKALESPHDLDFQMRVGGSVTGLSEMLFGESGRWRGRYYNCRLAAASSLPVGQINV